jgi:hypothetical protein
MGILSGATPLMVDVRQTGSSPQGATSTECAPMATSVSDRGEGGRAGHLVQATGGGVQRPAQTVVVEQRGGRPRPSPSRHRGAGGRSASWPPTPRSLRRGPAGIGPRGRAPVHDANQIKPVQHRGDQRQRADPPWVTQVSRVVRGCVAAPGECHLDRRHLCGAGRAPVRRSCSRRPHRLACTPICRRASVLPDRVGEPSGRPVGALSGCAGEEGGHDVGGVPVERHPGPVVAHGGARVGV